MNKSGYVKFDRKILNWGWYKDPNTFRLFFHLIMSANFADGEFMGVTIKRGQVARSYSNLVQETGMTERNVRTALEHLRNSGEVTVERHPKFSLFTVVKYNWYQSSDRQATPERQASDTRATGKRHRDNKNNKNNKNNEGESYVRACEEEHHQEIADCFNSLCPSLPPVKTLTASRCELIDKLLGTYSLDTVWEIFAKAEKSSFLKGKKNKDGKDWVASFDWLICTNNAAKVLDGLYDDRDRENANQKDKGTYDFEAFEKRAFERIRDASVHVFHSG